MRRPSRNLSSQIRPRSGKSTWNGKAPAKTKGFRVTVFQNRGGALGNVTAAKSLKTSLEQDFKLVCQVRSRTSSLILVLCLVCDVQTLPSHPEVWRILDWIRLRNQLKEGRTLQEVRDFLGGDGVLIMVLLSRHIPKATFRGYPLEPSVLARSLCCINSAG